MATEVPENPVRKRTMAEFWYFVAGLGVTLGSVYIGVRWNDVIRWISPGSLAGLDSHPPWFSALAEAVAALSWIVGGCLIVARLWGHRNIHVGSYLLGVVVSWSAMIGWFVLGGPIDDYFSRLPFDSAAWKTDRTEQGERPDRQRMIEDLMERRLLTRLDGKDVERLLGPADVGASGPNGELTYALGPDRGIGIDTELFVIRFGEDGKVVETYLRTD